MQLPTSARWPLRATLLGLLSLVATLSLLVAGCRPPESLADDRQGWGRRSATPGATSPAASSSLPPQVIAALGDSYSSGEGSLPYDSDSPGCDRGAGAWPRLLAQKIPGSTARMIACSGSTTNSFTASYREQPPQEEALRTMVASGTKPTIVTVTVGGNDAGFGPILTSCVIWRCFWNGQDDDREDFVTKTLPDMLETTYSEVKAAAPDARVIVVGYPSIVPSRSANSCKWLDSSERTQLAGLNSDLNRVAQRAAGRADVEFVSLSKVFSGHELCTSDPWIYPVGLNLAGPQASGHPNAKGQAAIAQAVYSYLAKNKNR